MVPGGHTVTGASSPNGRRPLSVLVLGGAGYLGSVLVPKLLTRGDRVTVLDALVYGDDGLRPVQGHPAFRIVKGDLRDGPVISEAMQGIDAVVHLGGLVGDPACELDPELTIEVNLDATATTVDAARIAGVRRFVFASSCSVYRSSDELLTENSPLEPPSIYAQTKAVSEWAVNRLASESFSPVCLRYGTLFGLAPRPRFDLMVNLLTAKAVKEGRFTIFGGASWRPFVHVEDAADATIKALDAPAKKVAGEVFNVGSDEENHTVAEVGELIRSVVPGTQVTYDLERAGDDGYRVSFKKIKDTLGFTPQWSVLDGIKEIERALEQGDIADFTDQRHSNHASLATAVDDLRGGVEPEVVEG